ncbi:TonB-dependent siderophore receptor [Aliarcobacter vitoriensis]|uniref:TonB-dependent siderophore receptor n=2 Tax=Aliarcobacter vitoriensis TaxID=2011099 RepID=A0A366MT90_9BACT|nr:TonB-dependent siderophore receptor [Aliarcobacter vitoriensis]RBQ29267.1 TonB-dependent siderophore receptor [Aliarcobacter vitoriensis]
MQEDGVIYIIEKPKYQNFGNTTVLDEISVSSSNYKNGSAESGYLVDETSGIGIWNERKLQDTPYSMNIISKDLIENVQAKDMRQIFKMNPTTQQLSRALNGNGDSSFPTMRGFAVYNPIINGIPSAHQSASTPMMQDIERVEIISGATGFLYGGGRVGGAVNYITKKPTTKDLRNISIGSYGKESYYGHIDLGGQFDEDNTFGYRINGLYQDGELSDTSTKEQKAISFVFDWKPTDNFYTDIKYSYKDILTKGSDNSFNPSSGFDRASINKSQSYSPDWIESEFRSNKIENSIRYDINDIFTLRTNLFYEETKSKQNSAVLFVQNGYAMVNNSYLVKGSWAKIENYGLNLFLDSKFDTGNISHTLTIGHSLNSTKSYFSSDLRNHYNFTNDIRLSDLKNFAKPDNSFWSDNGISGTQPRKLGWRTEYKNILIGDDIVFNDNWSALVGANYTTVIDTSYRSGVQSSKYDVSELTPTLSLIYKPFENLTTYATYMESLEAGEIVEDWYQNVNEVLDPYKSTQYEIGAKYSMLDEKALLTASLFRIEKANSYEIPTTPLPTLTQDGEAIHQGIEIGVTGKVTDNLTLMGGGTLMDLSVEKHSDKSLEGKKPTQAATKMAKLFAEYNIPYINGLSINAGAYYTGKSYANSSNTDVLPSYTLYDAGLRYQTKLDKYPTTFNLNVQNLTDKVYWTNAQQLGDPRAVAFSIKMEF